MGATLTFGGHRFELLACGALHWPQERLLAVADLHLEKGSAAAREGWLLPPYDSLDTLRRLHSALVATGARTLLSLGDSLDDADAVARMAPSARMLLERITAAHRCVWIAGNHDGAAAAEAGGLAVPEWEALGIRFRHVADLSVPGPEISGHFHPVVTCRGAHGRTVRRRCFARVGDRLVLPAYGSYAGGLDVASRDLAAALGGMPEALVPSRTGLRRIAMDRQVA